MPFPADLAANSLIGIILGLAQRNRGRKTSRLDVPARDWRVGRTRKSVAFLPRPTNARGPARCRISVQILLVREHPAAVSVRRSIWSSSLLNSSAGGQAGRRDGSLEVVAPAVTSGLAGPVFALCMLTSDFTAMIAALAATSRLVGFHLGPIFAIAWTVRKARHAGAGPLAVGTLNDPLKNDFGAQAVSYSLLSAAVTRALLFIWAAGSIRSDIQRASWFDQPAASPLPFVFVTVSPRPTSRRPDSLSVRRPVCDLHHG